MPEDELARHIRVANGRGSFADKRQTLGEMSHLGLPKTSGSIQKYSAERAEKLTAQRSRIQSGKATPLDLIDKVSHLSVAELTGTQNE